MEDEEAENAEMEMEEEIEDDDDEEGEEGDYSVHQNWTESDQGFIREKNWPRPLQTYKNNKYNKDYTMHKIFKPQEITKNEDHTGHLVGKVDDQSEENRIVNGYEAGVKYLIQFHQI